MNKPVLVRVALIAVNVLVFAIITFTLVTEGGLTVGWVAMVTTPIGAYAAFRSLRRLQAQQKAATR